MQIKVSEFVEDESGGHFIHYTREQDISATSDRHCDLCKLCGFPTYPECVEYCSVGQFKDKSRE